MYIWYPYVRCNGPPHRLFEDPRNPYSQSPKPHKLRYDKAYRKLHSRCNAKQFTSINETDVHGDMDVVYASTQKKKRLRS